MNRTEAAAILAEQLERYRAKPYAELLTLTGDLEVYEVSGPSGHHYQIEIEVMWDHKPGGELRVVASIDDGGWSAIRPLCQSLLVPPHSRPPRRAAEKTL